MVAKNDSQDGQKDGKMVVSAEVVPVQFGGKIGDTDHGDGGASQPTARVSPEAQHPGPAEEQKIEPALHTDKVAKESLEEQP